MGYILAIDQGATKTAALVAGSDGRILGVGYGGGACHSGDGMAMAMDRVRSAALAALRAASVDWADVTLVSGGMAGADWPHEYPLLERALREATGVADVRVVNDCIIAFRAGTDSPAGAVLCTGTGMNAAVVSPAGDAFIFGYYVHGDDNGGTALGRLALRAVFRAEAGLAPATALRQALLARFGLPTVDALLQALVEGRLGQTAELVPLLVEVVRAGDAIARQLVADFGRRQADYALAGLRRFDMLAHPADVVLSGGIFKADLPGLRQALAEALRSGAPLARLVDAGYEPVVGALLLALDQQTGRRVPLAALAQDARKFNLERIRA